MEDFAMQFGTNLGSMAVGVAIFVIYKRCLACRSHLDTGWLECTSPALEEAKNRKTVNVFKSAMREFHKESIKDGYTENLRQPRSNQESEV